jgi:hypothetical protein
MLQASRERESYEPVKVKKTEPKATVKTDRRNPRFELSKRPVALCGARG